MKRNKQQKRGAKREQVSVVDRIDEDECSAGSERATTKNAFFLLFNAPVVTFETKLRY